MTSRKQTDGWPVNGQAGIMSRMVYMGKEDPVYKPWDTRSHWKYDNYDSGFSNFDVDEAKHGNVLMYLCFFVVVSTTWI